MKNQEQAPMSKMSSHVLTQNMTVHITSDLSKFSAMDGNRPPNPQHIRRLADSIRVYGMLCNPILINEKNEVIDGQHRLLAAKDVQSPIYYIKIDGYNLEQVHALNLNQKNWTTADFLQGYASMGLEDYIMLREFWARHHYYNLTDCIAMCSNLSTASNMTLAKKYDKRVDKTVNVKEIFNEGTWKVRDMNKAEDDALRIKLIEPYYSGYNKSGFIGTMLLLFKNPSFDFNEFMSKVRLQPTALVDCANRTQYRSLVEDIYNFRRREKINLRY
jgi:hypothetical protein